MKKLLTILIIISSSIILHGQTATLTLNDGVIVQANPNVPGANDSYYTSYDNLNKPKSLTGTLNWTFEPLSSRQIMVVNQTFTQSNWGNNNIDDQPFQDYYVGGSFYVITSQSGLNTGCTGPITANDGLVSITSGTGGTTTNLVLSAASAPSSGSATYTGTITGGASNGLLNYNVIITGFTNTGNNGTFIVTASTGTSITVKNNNSVAETTTANASYTLATIVSATNSRFTPGNLFFVFNSSNGNFNGYTKGNIISVSGASAVVSYSSTTISGETTSGGQFGQIGGPVAEQTYTTSTTCPAAFQAGDVVQITKEVFPTPAVQWATNSSGDYGFPTGLSSDTTDLCATCGTQSLEMNGISSATQITFPWDTAPKINVYRLINGTYTLSFDAKLLSGSTTGLTGSVVRGGTNGVNCTGLKPTLTTSWAHYTLSCTAHELGISSGDPSCVAGGTTTGCTNPSIANSNATIEIQVNGSDLYIDNVQFTNNADINPTFYDVNYVNSLIAARIGSLRNWGNQNGATISAYIPQTDNFSQPSGASGNFGGPSGTPYGAANPIVSLPQFLNVAKYVQSQTGLPLKVYAMIPITFSPTEASEMIDYLSGDGTTTYGALRIAQGQTTPWTSVFPFLYLSYGNESWNGNFANQNLPDRGSAPTDQLYYDYSHSAKSIFTSMRANSFFTSNTLLGFDAQTPVEVASATLAVAQPDYIEIEGYWWNNNNEWDNLCGLTTPAATYDSCLWTPPVAQQWSVANGPIFNQSTHTGDPLNIYKSIQDYTSYLVCGASGSAPCQVTSYETGPGLLGGNNGVESPQADLDQANAGAFEADLTAIVFGSRVKAFNLVQNFFAAGGYNNGGGNGNIFKGWGWTVDNGGATNNKRPTYWGFQMLTNSMIGAEYQCDISGSGTTISVPYMDWAGIGPGTGSGQNHGTSSVSALPVIWSYCYMNGSNRSLLLINTDTANTWTVNFSGTNVPTGTITKRDFNPSTAPNPPAAPWTSIDTMNEQYYGTGTAGYTALTPSEVETVTTSISAPGNVTLNPGEMVALDFATSGTPTVNNPTFSPVAGTYTTTQTVSLNTTTSGATICYKIGSAPSASTPGTCDSGSTTYSTPITVSSTQEIEALGTESGFTNSAVSTATYTILPVAGTPTFSPTAGTYTSTQTVTITNPSSAPLVCYNTTGASIVINQASSCPSGSTTYTSPLTVSASETLHVVAGGAGFTDSSTATGAYIIEVPAATPTFSPVAGTYTTTQTVTITSSTSGSTIYYTTDGSTPTTSSTQYATPISVSATQTIKAIATASGFLNSAVGSALYTILPTAGTPTFSPVAGTYSTTQTVSIENPSSAPLVCYNTTGATIVINQSSSCPSGSTTYTSAITVSTNETIYAVAGGSGFADSSRGSATYVISSILSSPTYSPAAGTYTATQLVILNTTSSGATICYKIGSAPSASTPGICDSGSTTYTTSISVSSNETIYSLATKSGSTNSSVSSAAYVIAPVLSTPVLTPNTGTYNNDVTITITGPEGATFCYAINANPTASGGTCTSGSEYTAPITVSSTETLNVIASESGFTNSLIGTATYTLETAPTVFAPVSGTYDSTQTVTLSSATSGTTIYYTIDGSTPTTSSTVYSTGISVNVSTIIKALAVSEFGNSTVTTSTYTIVLPISTSTTTFGNFTFFGSSVTINPN